MHNTDTPAFRSAIADFAISSGKLALVVLDAAGQVLDFNDGFQLAVKPIGDPRGRLIGEFISTPEGDSSEIVPGLSGSAPIPYSMVAWTGDELLFHAYPLDEDRVLLIGEQASPAEQAVVRRMGRLNTEMSNLVRELHRANRRNEELAQTDPLTGLANRRQFFDMLSRVQQQVLRSAQPLTVLMMDLDYFKQVNDRFGHDGGDRLLVDFAAQLGRDSRSGDLAARLGGEEFALLLSDTALDQALQVAERIRQDTANLRTLGPEHAFHVSIGVAQYCSGETSNELMRRADRALYAAKNSGRNRVETAHSGRVCSDQQVIRPGQISAEQEQHS